MDMKHTGDLQRDIRGSLKFYVINPHNQLPVDNNKTQSFVHLCGGQN